MLQCASIVGMAAEGESPYQFIRGVSRETGAAHMARGFAMVFTTLDFAEKYLLKTEIRSLADMPGADADFESGSASGDARDAVPRDYAGNDYPDVAH